MSLCLIWFEETDFLDLHIRIILKIKGDRRKSVKGERSSLTLFVTIMIIICIPF
jgi:hypothetical protein